MKYESDRDDGSKRLRFEVTVQTKVDLDPQIIADEIQSNLESLDSVHSVIVVQITREQP